MAPSAVENADIARTFSAMADLLELLDRDPFKVRAYRRAAQVLDTFPRPIAELSATELCEVPAIGKRLAEKIGELLARGTFRDYEQLASEVPPGLLDILLIEGVGSKLVASAWRHLGVTSLDAFEEACRSGRALALPHMGPTRQKGLLEAIGRHRRRAGRMLLHRALPYAEAIIARLRGVPGVERAEVAGSARRRKETVADLDLLVAALAAEPVLRTFTQLPDVGQVVAVGPTKATVRLKIGLQVDLRVLPPESFGAALHYFTGSKQHNIELRTRAVRMGLKLSEYGVFDREDHRLAGAEEEEVFRAVGLPWIPPELREGVGEIDAAQQGRLPRLVEEREILGDLHVHSTGSSDARSDVGALTQEARRLGRGYIAITDHSRSRPLGLDLERLREQARRLRALDRDLEGRPHVLAGIEVDILADGALDLPADELRALDWVVASVHSRFSQSEAEMTERLVRALRSRAVDVLGHPTGRLLGRRDPYHFDLGRVLEAAREAGAALELNAQPERLDLNDKMCRQAKEAGVPVVISSDAHLASHLGNLRYGIWVARRGWLEARDVLNTQTAAALGRGRRERRAR